MTAGKSKITVNDDFENKVETQDKKYEALLKRIQELETEKGQVTANGKMIYGNQSTGKLWGKKISLMRGNLVYKDFPYLIFGDGYNTYKVEFSKPTEVPLGVYETIMNHVNHVQTYKQDPESGKLTNQINDINVHYRCDDLGDVYK